VMHRLRMSLPDGQTLATVSPEAFSKRNDRAGYPTRSR